MSRRSFGSVRKRRSGRWEARYTHPDTGEMFYRYFITKAEAEDFLSITDSELLRGDWLDPNQASRPIRLWAEDWYGSLRRPRPRTLATYRTAIDKHIVPHLGDVPMVRLSSERVDTWTKELEQAGVGPATVSRAFRVLSMMMGNAVRRRYLRFNPCQEAESPQDPDHRAQVILMPAQVAALAEAMEVHGQQYRSLVLLAAYGGLRWGEVTGLGLQHVDWLRRRVRVERQLHPDGRLDAPKTKAGTRWVDIPSWLCDELSQTVAGRQPTDDTDLLFLSDQGQALNHSNFRQRVWLKARATLPEDMHALRFHDLRHTAVAIYLESGRQAGQPINPKELQLRMGHSSITMTLDRYGHLLDKVEDAVVEAMPSPFLTPAASAEVVELR